MAFDALLGNRRLKDNLIRSLGQGHISHFYLICGPAGAGKHTLARLLAAAILCREQGRPCLACGPCRKVLSGNHPDFITVDEPEKKTVPVETVRAACRELYIRPNESDHKILLFPRAQDMRAEAQNALLKVLEEPPEHGIFFLLSDSPERLLPTVRSRCTLLSLSPLAAEELREALRREFPQAEPADVEAAILRGGGFFGQAKALLSQGTALPPQTEQFAAAYGAKNALALTETLVPMEKWKRDALISALNQWLELLEGALVCRSGGTAVTAAARTLAAGRSPQELMHGILCLQKSVEYAQGNVSPAAICSWLAWELR